MNHQTEKILKDAKDTVDNWGGFTADQVTVLHKMIDKIGEAIAKESDCARSGPCCN